MEDEEETVANVCVAVRCRPMSNKETSEGQSPIVEFPAGGTQVVLHSKGEPHSYAFDHVFGIDSEQPSVYEALGCPLINKAFDGFNATIFAYGQTGSGKTHTMMNHKGGPDEKGLIPRINAGLFERITKEMAESETRRFLVCCSFMEIYNEVIFDLLVPRSKQAGKVAGLEIREQKGIGTYVKDLTEHVVESPDKLNQMIEQGFEHRSTAATKMNDASSRSHCIFVIRLHQKDASDESKNTFSKINLVDLAGSERAKSTEAEGDRLKEGANINKSLSALGNVINALSSQAASSKKVFVPYRNSKLTRVLQESLGGNSLCTMVAAMSPANTNAEETLSTLNYARRAKTIKVSASKNEESSALKKLEDEVSALKAKLEQQALQATSASMSSNEKKELDAKYVNQIEELQSFMKQSWQDKQKLSEEYEQKQARAAEEAAKAVEKVRNERKRRMKMLEDKGDLAFSLQSLAGLESTVSLNWTDLISSALKAEQHMRSQLHCVKLFRDSAGSDFSMWWSRRGGDHSVSLTLLGQVHTKLGSMRKELEALARLELQLEENMGQIGPKVGLSLREAQTQAANTAEGEAEDELVELLSLVQRQVAQHQAKARASIREERHKLGFDKELGWLTESLEESSSPESPSNSRQTLRLALQAAAQQSAGEAAAMPEGDFEVPVTLGLSNLEWPDDRITASSNDQSSHCARLLQNVAFGGWCAQVDSESEYLQVDLGEERCVAALSLQGRQPCTSEWSQTRDLLRLAIGGDEALLPSGDKLPSAEKFYKRPPVRLVHDVSVALAGEKKCFDGWEVPIEFHAYPELSREQKVAFFDEIVKRASDAFPSLDMKLTTQDVLSGKNCEESNRLLQILAYLSFRTGSGLDDATAQWTTAFKLEVFTEAAGWRWCGAPDGSGSEQATTFEGNADATSVRYVTLPQDIVASQVRVHPATWHGHASFRCEVHVASKGAVLASSKTGSSGGAEGGSSSSSLESCVDLVCQGIQEVQKGIQENQAAKTAEEESKKAEVMTLKDKAEQERDDLEKRLQDALARLTDLEGLHTVATEKAAEAETCLLQMTVERDRLSSDCDQLQGELSTRTQGKTAAEEQIALLKDDSDELKSSVEELTSQLEVMTEERDLARSKEEELFEEKLRFEEEIMDTNNGYVWVTERLQEKEEEMENVEEQLRKLQSGNECLSERCSELQDELMALRVEHQALQGKLAEEVRMHKAAQDRYVKVLKDRTMEGAPAGMSSRPETVSTDVSSTLAQGPAKTPEKASGADKAEEAYEDDFDDED